MSQESVEFLDLKLIIPIITASLVIIGVIVTQYQTKKREVQAAHRLRQGEVYGDFVQKAIVKAMQGARRDQFQLESDEEFLDYMTSFAGELIVWGSLSVVRAYRDFHNNAGLTDPGVLFSALDELLKKMREDLGHKDKGLKRYELYSLFLKGNEDIKRN